VAGFLFLVCLALLFIALPALGRKRSHGRASRNDSSQDWYLSRVSELDEDAADEDVREEIRAELGAVLLAEAPGSETTLGTGAESTDEYIKGLKLLLASGAVLVVSATLIYNHLGNHRLPEIRGAEVVLELSAETDKAEVLSWQSRLDGWLAENPEDAKSSYLLGHAFLKLGNFSGAAKSFADTNALIDNDISVKFYWLQSRYLANRGVLDDTSKRLAEEILKVDPTNESVLEVLAIAAINEGETASAITLLNQSLAGFRDARSQATTIQAIVKLRKSLDPKPKGVSVNISAIAPVDPAATLFIVARPVGGGMPFAAVRRPAGLLPLTVRIDDLVSMSDQRKLSNAEEFEIMVRLSASGIAQAQEGDWVWRSSAFKFSDLAQLPVEAVLVPSKDTADSDK
jgi:cytochrome c-type biogenesis protein CcmH